MSNSLEHRALLLTLVRTQPLMCDGQLERWREVEDSVARAENALLKYYLRTAKPRKEVTLTILAAA